MIQRKLIRHPDTGALSFSQAAIQEVTDDYDIDGELESKHKKSSTEIYLSTNLVQGVPTSLAGIQLSQQKLAEIAVKVQ